MKRQDPAATVAGSLLWLSFLFSSSSIQSAFYLRRRTSCRTPPISCPAHPRPCHPRCGAFSLGSRTNPQRADLCRGCFLNFPSFLLPPSPVQASLVGDLLPPPPNQQPLRFRPGNLPPTKKKSKQTDPRPPLFPKKPK